jgi:hypothetical protein
MNTFTVRDATHVVDLDELRAAVRWLQTAAAGADDEALRAAVLFLTKSMRVVEVELVRLSRRRGRGRRRQPQILRMPATKVDLWGFKLVLPEITGGTGDDHLSVIRRFLDIAMGPLWIESATSDGLQGSPDDSRAAVILNGPDTPEPEECPPAANLANPEVIESGGVEEEERPQGGYLSLAKVIADHLSALPAGADRVSARALKTDLGYAVTEKTWRLARDHACLETGWRVEGKSLVRA